MIKVKTYNCEGFDVNLEFERQVYAYFCKIILKTEKYNF
jgi:hypothetical protein